MELPPLLRQAVDRALHGVPLSPAASAALSERDRADEPGGAARVLTHRDALAYLAVRLPATHAAVRASLAAVAAAAPKIKPNSRGQVRP